jgi:hypothetical protein
MTGCRSQKEGEPMATAYDDHDETNNHDVAVPAPRDDRGEGGIRQRHLGVAGAASVLREYRSTADRISESLRPAMDLTSALGSYRSAVERIAESLTPAATLASAFEPYRSAVERISGALAPVGALTPVLGSYQIATGGSVLMNRASATALRSHPPAEQLRIDVGVSGLAAAMRGSGLTRDGVVGYKPAVSGVESSLRGLKLTSDTMFAEYDKLTGKITSALGGYRAATDDLSRISTLAAGIGPIDVGALTTLKLTGGTIFAEYDALSGKIAGALDRYPLAADPPRISTLIGGHGPIVAGAFAALGDLADPSPRLRSAMAPILDPSPAFTARITRTRAETFEAFEAIVRQPEVAEVVDRLVAEPEPRQRGAAATEQTFRNFMTACSFIVATVYLFYDPSVLGVIADYIAVALAPQIIQFFRK